MSQLHCRRPVGWQSAAGLGVADRRDASRLDVMKVADILKVNADLFTDWVTREQGKPLGGVGPG